MAASRPAFKVADLSLAEWGRREIRLAEHEMPGLMALRRRSMRRRSRSPARRIMGSLHMTVQTAVLIETLVDLGADVRWVSCNIFSTQDHAAAAVAVGRNGTVEEARAASPSSRGRARRSRSTGGAPSEALIWPDGSGPDLIVDDGGDATLLVHKGLEFEKAGKVPDFDAGEGPRGVGRHPRPAARAAAGATRGAGTRVAPRSAASPRRRRPACTASTRWRRTARCSSPRSTSTTRSRRASSTTSTAAGTRCIDGLNRATDVMLGGKVAVVCGFGEVGKGCAAGAARPGLPRDRDRDRPDLRAAGGDGGLPGRDARGRRRDGRHLRHRDRQLRTSSPPTTWRA